MPNYKQAPIALQKRREQLKQSLDESRDILPDETVKNIHVTDVSQKPQDSFEETKIDEKNEVGEGRGEAEEENGPENRSKPIAKLGRPKKQTSIIRDMPRTIKFDKTIYNKLREVKYNYEFDFQDIVFLAVKEYLDNHFPKGKAGKEDLKNIIQQIEELNGKKMKRF